MNTNRASLMGWAVNSVHCCSITGRKQSSDCVAVFKGKKGAVLLGNEIGLQPLLWAYIYHIERDVT